MDNDAQMTYRSSAATLMPDSLPPAHFAVSRNTTIAAPPFLLTVAIPVYNEKATLRELLARVQAVDLPLEILLVDDGSTDGSREILRDEIEGRDPAVRVYYHERNQGKGAAILTAIAHATGDYLIVQDADLEYDPQEYHRLLPPLREGKTPVVYGSRFQGSVKNMKTANWIANRLLTIAANLLFPGAHLTDEATCYKMFRVDLLRGLGLRARRFDFCPEVTAKVLKHGHRIVEVPINYSARTTAQGKKIHWTDGVYALWTLIKYRFIN